MRVSNWTIWTRRKKQAGLILFFLGFGIAGKMDNGGGIGYGVVGIIIAFVALFIFSTIRQHEW